MRRGAAILLASLVFGGCLGLDDEEASPPAVGPAVTARCEGGGPQTPDWRRGVVAVGRFGLMAPDLRWARELRNGNFGVKMGAVVEGDVPVTVRVPEEERGRVGLVYGNASRGRGKQLSAAPVEVTFKPCSNRLRSGWAGGLLLDTIREPVTLEVRLTDSRTEPLTIEPAPPESLTGTRPSGPIIQTRKTTCPTSLTGGGDDSDCKLAFEGVELVECPSGGPGGFDVMVAGISCQEGRDLRLPFGNPFRDYRGQQEVVYRPRLATGPLDNVQPEEVTGWACWAHYDRKDPEGIRHVCWRGSDVLLFKTG